MLHVAQCERVVPGEQSVAQRRERECDKEARSWQRTRLAYEVGVRVRAQLAVKDKERQREEQSSEERRGAAADRRALQSGRGDR